MTSLAAAKADKLKLVLFGLLVLGTAAAFVATGLMRRPLMHDKAGRLWVEIVNESEVRLRTDIYVEGQPVILEWEPGKSGMVRFNPKEQVDVMVRVYRRNQLVSSFREQDVPPNEPTQVTFRLTAQDRAEIVRGVPEIASVEGGTP